MVEKKQVELKRLWELAEAGMSADQIMKQLDITDRESLKHALQELMREKGESEAIKGLIGDPALYAMYTDDGIRISPAMLQETMFHRGDRFDFKIEGDKIVLTKAQG